MQADPAKFAPFAHRSPNRPAEWFLAAPEASPEVVLKPGFLDSCRQFGLFIGDVVRVRCGHPDPIRATYLTVVLARVAKPAPVVVALLGKPVRPAIVAEPEEAAA